MYYDNFNQPSLHGRYRRIVREGGEGNMTWLIGPLLLIGAILSATVFRPPVIHDVKELAVYTDKIDFAIIGKSQGAIL